MTIKSAMALEDKMSSTLFSMEKSLSSTSKEMRNAEKEAARLQKAYDDTSKTFSTLETEYKQLQAGLQEVVDLAKKGYDPDTTAYVKLGQGIEESVAKLKELESQLDTVGMTLGEQEENLDVAARAVQVLGTSYNTIEDAVLIQERLNEKIGEGADAYKNAQASVNSQTLAIERATRQMEIYEQRIEGQRDKLGQVAEQIIKTEIELERLNAAQEEISNPIVQERIDELNNELIKLEKQYDNIELSIKRAENTHITAMNRMSVATTKMNPMINGLNMSLRGLPAPMRQFGMVGTQSLGSIVSGAKAATIAMTALKAAMGIGIGIAIGAGISFLVSKFDEMKKAGDNSLEAIEKRAQKAKQEMDKLQEATDALRRKMSGLDRDLIGSAKSSWEAYFNKLESANSMVTNMMFQGELIEKTWNTLKNLSSVADKSIDQQKEMERLLKVLEFMLPGINIKMLEGLVILDEEKQRVTDLIGLYKELAFAKMKADVYAEISAEAFKQQTLIEHTTGPKLYQEFQKAEQERDRILDERQKAIDERLKKEYQMYFDYQTAPGMKQTPGGVMTYEQYVQSATKDNKYITEIKNQYKELLDPVEKLIGEYLTEAAQLTELKAGYKEEVDKYMELAFGTREGIATLEKQLESGGIDLEKMYEALKVGVFGAYEDALGIFSFDNQKNLKVKIKEDDIKMLHDIATEMYRPVYQTITPSLVLNDTIIRETADVDAIFDEFANQLEEVGQVKLLEAFAS